MNRFKIISYTILFTMSILSFTNIFGYSLAGWSVVLGAVFYFIYTFIIKQDDALQLKEIKRNFKVKRIWLWMLLPLVMDAISITVGMLILPEYINHVIARTEVFLSFDQVILMVLQLAFLALGEEIAWRAFFQKQLYQSLPVGKAIVVTSLLFTLGHYNAGSIMAVAYDMIFIFINSVLYGVIFHKTNNAWMSAISHFTANLFSILVLILL